MLAPYWAPTDLRSFVNGPSKVFYHIYEGPGSNAMLKKATADVLSVFSSKLPQGKNFSASWVLVVTWQDIRHQLQNDITKNLVRFSEYMDTNIQNKLSFVKLSLLLAKSDKQNILSTNYTSYENIYWKTRLRFIRKRT